MNYCPSTVSGMAHRISSMILLSFFSIVLASYDPEAVSDFILDIDPQDACTCSQDAPMLFANYLDSETFLSVAASNLLPEEVYSVLISRVIPGYKGHGYFPDDVFSAILDGNYDAVTTTTTSPVELSEPEDEETRFVEASQFAVTPIMTNFRRRWVEPDDVILTNAVPDLIKVADAIHGTGESDENWYIFLSEKVNTELFLIHSQVEQISECRTLQCRIWREVLRQLHYRVAIAFSTKFSMDFVEFSSSVSPVLQGLIMEGMKARADKIHQPKCMIAVTVAVAVPIVAEAGIAFGCWCLGQCIKFYRARYTTTTPIPSTLPLTIPVDSEYLVKLGQGKTFFKTATASLDEVVKILGSVDVADGDFDNKIMTVRRTVIMRVMEITTGVTKIGVDMMDINPAVELAFDINASMSTGPITPSNWKDIKGDILRNISGIRAELIKLVFQFV